MGLIVKNIKCYEVICDRCGRWDRIQFDVASIDTFSDCHASKQFEALGWRCVHKFIDRQGSVLCPRCAKDLRP